MKNVYLILLYALIGAMPVMAQKSAPKRASFTLEAPTVEKATNISSNGFTAHWQPVDGAEGYCIFVYTKDVAPADGEYIIIDEDFNGMDFGSLIEPGGGDEYNVTFEKEGYETVTVPEIEAEYVEMTPVTTGVSNVSVTKAVASVKYYNAAGVASSEAFSGVNIVVTKYADGTQTVTKIVE